jgi:hypothetical protein
VEAQTRIINDLVGAALAAALFQIAAFVIAASNKKNFHEDFHRYPELEWQ